MRDAFGDVVETRQRILDPRLVRDGDHVQESIRGSAHRDVESNSIVDCVGGDDVAEAGSLADELAELGRRGPGQVLPRLGYRADCARSQADHRVEAVRLYHRLHRVGDQFARGQRVAHSFVSHRDPVVDADGVELEWDSAGSAYGIFYNAAELLEVHVSGNDVHVGVAHRDE